MDAPPQFPLPDSAQRSKPVTETPAVPTFELEVDEPEDRDDEDEDDGPPTPKPLNRTLPSTTASSTSLPPPPSTTTRPTPVPRKGRGKVALAPGCSPLDWAKLKTSGTDLRAIGPLSSELFTPTHSNPFGGGFLRVTPDELAKHNKKEDCWTVFNGKVYNVTAYLKFHPGGEGQMMRTAGRDGTKLFSASASCLKSATQILRTSADRQSVDLVNSVDSCMGERGLHA
jgi:cytochrome b involved in lipid metabolism